MTEIGRIISYALVLVFAENILFSRGLGSDVVLRLSVNPKDFFRFGIILTTATMISSVIGWGFSAVVSLLNVDIANPSLRLLLRTLVYLICLSALYVAFDRFMNKHFETRYSRFRKAMPIAIFNTAVLGAPAILARMEIALANTANLNGFLAALFVGAFVSIGFLIAVALMSEGIKQIESMDLPYAFSGLPARFIYIGLLAMAFSAISGRQADF